MNCILTPLNKLGLLPPQMCSLYFLLSSFTSFLLLYIFVSLTKHPRPLPWNPPLKSLPQLRHANRDPHRPLLWLGLGLAISPHRRPAQRGSRIERARFRAGRGARIDGRGDPGWGSAAGRIWRSPWGLSDESHITKTYLRKWGKTPKPNHQLGGSGFGVFSKPICLIFWGGRLNMEESGTYYFLCIRDASQGISVSLKCPTGWP